MILDDEAIDMMKGLESPITIENKDDLIATLEYWKKKVDTLTVVAELADKLTSGNVKLVEENEQLNKKIDNWMLTVSNKDYEILKLKKLVVGNIN